VHDEFKPGQPFKFRRGKLKFQPKWLKTKGLSLRVVKKIRTDGTIELESPFSRRTKVVTKKLLQKGVIHLD